jgi:CubicO group peptidase (beta-lactamase class C family)
MSAWHVPGVALGVIKDGHVLVARGFGLRDVEQKLPVTPRTLMAIGSNTKSFTVVLLGMLVDEGKLEWDRPILAYLPDFRLWDEYATTHITARDLVTHRSGLPRHDLVWYGRSYSRKGLYDRLRHLEPTVSFREKWQYQNLMYMTAGYLAERLSGRSWEELIRERIFTPLGMTRSNTSVTDLPKADDFAYAYAWRDSALVRIPYRNIDAVGPAGSINSSVEDMLRYVQFRIDQGHWNGQQLLSKANEAEMQSGQMVAGGPGGSDVWPSIDLVTYGLGLAVGSYRGAKVVLHGGGIDGFISQMSWLPERKAGVVVLTNQGGNNPVPTLTLSAVYDRLLGLEPIDWAGKQRELEAMARQQADSARRAFAAARKPGTRPSHPLADYAGDYEHPGYGRLTVRAAGAGLELQLDGHRVPLGHYHYDVFEIGDAGSLVPFRGVVTFQTDAKGVVDRALVPLEQSLSPIAFLRARP